MPLRAPKGIVNAIKRMLPHLPRPIIWQVARFMVTGVDAFARHAQETLMVRVPERNLAVANILDFKPLPHHPVQNFRAVLCSHAFAATFAIHLKQLDVARVEDT